MLAAGPLVAIEGRIRAWAGVDRVGSGKRAWLSESEVVRHGKER